jgi:hypothetical protein
MFMRWRSITSATMLLALLNCALAPSSRPTTTPTTRPLASALVGTFHGTVVDDDETVPCLTTFHDYNGQPRGDYVVRVGTDEKYEGTLDQFKLVSAEQRECRFRWTDKHGTGMLTIRLTSDDQSFAGSWGMEIVQDELVWTGRREAPTTRRMHGSNN